MSYFDIILVSLSPAVVGGIYAYLQCKAIDAKHDAAIKLISIFEKKN